MSYTWITPKTDWVTSTAFTYTDYNRIRNNLLYINEKINELYPEAQQTLDLGDAKTGYTNEYRPSEFNAFEDALVSFQRVGFNKSYGKPNKYSSNGVFIGADDLNRIEKSCISWKEGTNVTVTGISITPELLTVQALDTYSFDVEMIPSNAPNKDYELSSVVKGSISCIKDKMKVKATVTKDELSMATMTVSVKGKNISDSAVLRYGNGSWFVYPMNNAGLPYYYPFIYLGSDLDASGVSTMLGYYVFGKTDSSDEAYKGLKGTYGINRGWDESYKGEDCPYRVDIQNFIDTNFSTQLKNALVSVTKWEQKGYTDRYQYTSKFFLPSIDEVFLSTGDTYPSLKTVTYDWLSDYYTRPNRWNIGFIDDKDLHSVLTRTVGYSKIAGGEYRYCPEVVVASGKATYNSIQLNGFYAEIRLRPLFFLDKNTKVKASDIADLDYEIDWTGQSNVRLCDIAVGQVVGDRTGKW